MDAPIILGPRGGEAISDNDRRRVAILAGRDEVVLTESWYTPGERGPDPHIHRHHVDAFYLLEGELVFGVGPRVEEVVATPGTLVLVPPDVVHTFWNAGPADARWLNVHAPGAAFDEYLRAARDGREPAVPFDADDPPDDGGLPASDVVIRGPGEGDTISTGVTTARFKAEVDDGGGRFSLTETTLAPEFSGPPRHRHDALVDTFYVVEGTLTVQVGDEKHRLAPGSFALVPPGTPHTFANETDVPVREVNLMAPGGFEQYLKEIAALGGDGPPDPTRVAEIASRYDIHPAE